MSSLAPTRTDAFRDALAAESPVVEVRIADERHEVDGLLPSIAVAPSTEEQIARTLALAQAHGLSVIAHGGGRHVHIGNTPASYDVAIDTTMLSRTFDHEPDDMTVTVDAGVSIGDLQRTLGERGQWLPIDPPCYPDATIGGLLAVNAYGPARHAYGTLRDWVIGMRVAHPDGTATKSGGRVVKNVSGYDMHKLHIGALGTLGVITQVTFKLAPLPHTAQTVAFAAPSAVNACSFVLRARDAGLAIEAAEVMPPASARAVVARDDWCALVRLAGSSSAVERSVRDLRALAPSLGGELDADIGASPWSRWDESRRRSQLELRVSGPPSRTAATMADLLDVGAPGGALMSATVAMGLIRINHQDEPSHEAAAGIIDATRSIAARCGGFTIIDSAPSSVKANIDVFGPPRSDFEVMRRLKEQFDPHGTLAPGRFVGRL